MQATRALTPTLDDLTSAREVFESNEPRDLFYRAATELVDLALRNATSLSLTESLAVLLQTWNQSFYQYRPFNVQHFCDIDNLLHCHQTLLDKYRSRSIETFVTQDEYTVCEVFRNFEQVLGPVGAAKSLHLLAPQFFPLWDRAIAKSYGYPLGRAGTNGMRYVAFMRITKDQVRDLRGAVAITKLVGKRN